VKPTIKIGTQSGYLFEGERVGSFVFVPATCIRLALGRTAEIDELGYSQSGWDVKNMRFNSGLNNGKRLYPNPKLPVTDLADPLVARFIERLQLAHKAKNVPMSQGPSHLSVKP
jgi:hypothetical protein